MVIQYDEMWLFVKKKKKMDLVEIDVDSKLIIEFIFVVLTIHE